MAEQRHGGVGWAYSKGISRSLAAEWGTPLSLEAFSCLEGPAVSIFSSGGVHLQTWARELQLVFPANRKVLQSILALRLRKKGSGRRALGTWVRSVTTAVLDVANSNPLTYLQLLRNKILIKIPLPFVIWIQPLHFLPFGIACLPLPAVSTALILATLPCLSPSPAHVCLMFKISKGDKDHHYVVYYRFLPRDNFFPSLPLKKKAHKTKRLQMYFNKWCCITAPFFQKNFKLKVSGTNQT